LAEPSFLLKILEALASFLIPFPYSPLPPHPPSGERGTGDRGQGSRSNLPDFIFNFKVNYM